MARRPPIDHKLTLKTIPLLFADGTTTEARAEGNNAAWSCKCGTPLVGRCYFQFGDTCYTECADCKRTYRVHGDDRKRANRVVEEVASNMIPVAVPAATH